MATYVVGDIQGCHAQFLQLLEHIRFDPARDRLWSTGDLVNRGPHSLDVLRYFRRMDNVIVVLGNHDLHLLAMAHGNRKHYKPGLDTIDQILDAPDRDDLLDWLRQRPLLHHDTDLGYTLIHAGLPPQWDLATARRCAAEVETVLRGEQAHEYFANHMYGNTPARWSEDLQGWERLRFITNSLTRLRYCDAGGALLLKKKHSPGTSDPDDHPWFMHPGRASRDLRIVFGHWSTLGYYDGHGVYALDTGCLWGGALTALRLEDAKIFQIRCPQSVDPMGVD